MKFVVTGATGFVGSSIVKALVARGADVLALARPFSSPERLENVPLTWLIADVTEPSTLHGLFEDVDYVIHAAGMLGQSGTAEADYMHLHVDGTRHVLDEVSKVDPQPKMLYVSSPGVLGPITGPPADEDAQLAPSNPYERSKAVAESLVRVYAAVRDTCRNRPSRIHLRPRRHPRFGIIQSHSRTEVLLHRGWKQHLPPHLYRRCRRWHAALLGARQTGRNIPYYRPSTGHISRTRKYDCRGT